MPTDSPPFVTIKARDLVPYKHAVWCTVDGIKEPFANVIMHVRWSLDGAKILIGLDSHNFDSYGHDDEADCVVERENLSPRERQRIEAWVLPARPTPATCLHATVTRSCNGPTVVWTCGCGAVFAVKP